MKLTKRDIILIFGLCINQINAIAIDKSFDDKKPASDIRDDEQSFFERFLIELSK